MSDTLAAVLTREPDWRSLPARTPRAAVAVLHRCLQKDPRQRVRDIADARMALAEADLDAGNPGRGPGARPGRARLLVATAITALLVGAAGDAWWRASREAPRQEWTGTRLGGPAIALDPRIAPDGQLLAFMAMVDGLTQVAVMKPGTQSWTVLTRDRSRGLAQILAWSPDGSRIYSSSTSTRWPCAPGTAPCCWRPRDGSMFRILEYAHEGAFASRGAASKRWPPVPTST